ncbi:YceI family protein [Deinococcus oregonensis]|uniref:YceI family protein n=1 Tax=Deinococcus oregonensis TaxID=1805970 RepID=A0ABV6AYS2_9DEIO
MMFKAVRFAILTLPLLLSGALAAPVTFTTVPVINDGALPNTATVDSETDFENFTGLTHDVRGTLVFDRQANTGSGMFIINGASIDTGNALRNKHMRSVDWLDFEHQPNIRFVTSAVEHVQGDQYRVRGQFTLHGVTRMITVTARLKYSDASFVQQTQNIRGNIVALSTTFPVKLSDYGVTNPGIKIGRVNDTLQITLKALLSDQH